MADLKQIYGAVTTQAAEEALKRLEEKGGKKYPLTIKSWNQNRHRLSQYFKYPKEIRKMICTTGITGSFHSQLRKVTTKPSASFPLMTRFLNCFTWSFRTIITDGPLPLQDGN